MRLAAPKSACSRLCQLYETTDDDYLNINKSEANHFSSYSAADRAPGEGRGGAITQSERTGSICSALLERVLKGEGAPFWGSRRGPSSQRGLRDGVAVLRGPVASWGGRGMGPLLGVGGVKDLLPPNFRSLPNERKFKKKNCANF